MRLQGETAFSLKGKNVLITGGGSGLGLAMAQCMDSCGAKVIIVGHSSEEKLKDAVALLKHGSYYLFDISKLEEVPSFIKKVEQEQGPIDVLVNNAGVHCKKPFGRASSIAKDRLVLPECQGQLDSGSSCKHIPG